MSEISATAFQEFEALAGLFGRTRLVLDQVIARGRLPATATMLLASETLPHIEGVEAGFRARLRTSESDVDELRGLLLRGGLGVPEPRDGSERRAALIEAMQALSGAGGPRRLAPAPGRELAALEHARIAMAMLPRTPPADVHFPGRRSYADIAVPNGPGEFVERIEEVERTIWRAASGRTGRAVDPVWRRVYAFFDAGERLSSSASFQA